LSPVFPVIPIPVSHEKNEKDHLSLGGTNIGRGHHFQYYPIMETTKVSKSKAVKIVEIIEYIPNSMASKTIIIPVHALNSIKANKHFKMMSAIVKGRYDPYSLPFVSARLAECGKDVT
jgi:hypothetical protein